MSSPKRESVTVLEECIDLQKRKSNDYQNAKSNVVQADHYRRGVSTIHDMISQKLLRAQSLLEAYENGENSSPNFESLEDTYKDLINYASFAVSYLRGKMEGQDPERDMLNRKTQQTQYYVKPQGGGTGTGVEVTEEEYIRSVQERAKTAPPYKEEVEQDGFITVWPALLGEPSESNKLDIPLAGDTRPGEARIKQTYFKKVLPKGEVRIPPGEKNCTDNVASVYETHLRSKRNRKPKDVGDRIEGEFDELAKKKSER